MSTYGEPALIITDGGLAGLLACFMEGVCRPAASLPRGGGSGTPTQAQSTAWFWWHAPPGERGEAEREARETTARSALAVCHLAELVVPLTEDDGTPLELRPRRATGERISRVLLSAGALAISRGLSRMIWPVHLGGAGGPAGTAGEDDRLADHAAGLDAIAEACDRALAASRLLSLDAGPEGFSIQTPFVDFTDAQIADLASDVDLPLAEAFLGTPDGLGAAEHRRWASALAAVGLDMPPPRSLLAATVLGSGARLKAV